MDREVVQAAVASLDREVPRSGARVRFVQYGGGPDEGKIVANELGYLRLGVEFLRAALAPRQDSAAVEVDLEYLVDEESDINFDWFERLDALPVSPPRSDGRWVGVAIAAVLASLGVLVCIGLVTVVRWLVT